jgi:hypothetical protein
MKISLSPSRRSRHHRQVVSLFRGLKKQPPQPYKLARLVDQRRREEAGRAGIHLVCDIDKTYLETEFESVVRMARIAFEGASDKITVAGAAEVLLSARWGDLEAPLAEAEPGVPRPLHFVSSSPPQLRPVLEEKMALDGLDWSSDTFKNQAYNIRMGRMDLLRQHVAYKSLAILNLAATAAPGSRFLLIGDNAESDAYIYAGLSLLLSGRLSVRGYRIYLETAGVEAEVAEDLTAGLPVLLGREGGAHAGGGPEVLAVLIRNVPGYALAAEPPLTDLAETFDNFFQAAILLMRHGVLPVERLWPLTRSFHNHHGMSRRSLAAALTAVREAAPAPAALAQAAADALRRLGADPAAARPGGEPPRALVQSLGRSRAAVMGLGEPEILKHAAAWAARLAAE